MPHAEVMSVPLSFGNKQVELCQCDVCNNGYTEGLEVLRFRSTLKLFNIALNSVKEQINFSYFLRNSDINGIS